MDPQDTLSSAFLSHTQQSIEYTLEYQDGA